MIDSAGHRWASSRWRVKLLITLIYFTTSFDLVNGHQLRPITKMLRAIVLAINLASGFYILLMLLSTKGNCEPNGLAATLGDWLAHLSYGSRIHIYSMLFCMICATILFHIVPILENVQGKTTKRNYVDYLSFYFKSPNRFLSKEDKFIRLIESYIRGDRFQLVGERSNYMSLLRSPCLFWHKDTFEQSDKLGCLMVLILVIMMTLLDTFVLLTILYMGTQPVNPSSPYLWQALEDPLRHKIKYEDGLCQVKSSRSGQVLYCISVFVVVVNLSIAGFIIVLWLAFQVSVVLMWTATVSDSLDELTNRRVNNGTEEDHHLIRQRDNADEADQLRSSANWPLRQRIMSAADVEADTADELQVGDDRRRRLSQWPDESNQQHNERHHHHYGSTPDELKVRCESLKYRADYRDWLEFTGPKGFPKSTELLETVAQNELLALMVSIKDSDQYVSVLNFISLAACFVFLSSGTVSYRRIDKTNDLVSLAAIMLGCASAVAANISSCALVNSRLLKLYRKLRVLIALTPVSNHNRAFWELASTYWFTQEGLKYGYTILGLVNSSWTHCFQSVSYVSSFLLLTYR